MWPVDNFKLSSCDSRGAALSGIAESDTKKRASQIPNLIYKWDLEGKLSDMIIRTVKMLFADYERS